MWQCSALSIFRHSVYDEIKFSFNGCICNADIVHEEAAIDIFQYIFNIKDLYDLLYTIEYHSTSGIKSLLPCILSKSFFVYI